MRSFHLGLTNVLVSVVALYSADNALALTPFAFGYNVYGQTGAPASNEPILLPQRIESGGLAGESIAAAAAGRFHSLLLGDDGKMFSFGYNPAGQLGLGHGEDVAAPTAVPLDVFGGRRVREIAAGHNQSFAVTEDGVAFAFGDNLFGRTGLGLIDGATHVPTAIVGGGLATKKVVQAAAGFDHSLLLTDDGVVYSMGYNGGGLTGLGTSLGTTTLVPTPIVDTNLGGRKISQIAAGHGVSLLLAEDGAVFSFGFRIYTGPGPSPGHTTVATAIDSSKLQGKKVTQVSAGSMALLLTEDGEVFSFVHNSLVTHLDPPLVATPIDRTNLGTRKIVQVSADGLILADDGALFSLDQNQSEQSALGTEVLASLIATPIDMTNLSGYRVKSISSGGHHSILLAAQVPEPYGLASAAIAISILSVSFRRRRTNANGR